MPPKRYVYCVISPIPPLYIADVAAPNAHISFVKFGDSNVEDERPGYSTHNPNYLIFSNDTQAGGAAGPTFNVGTALKKLVFSDRGFVTVNDNEWGVVYDDQRKLYEFAMGKFRSYDFTTDAAVAVAAADICANWIPLAKRQPA